ncbi:hypothetical protein SAMN02745192_1140 [Xylanibacter ruminicola]|nr:hypothetical protein SAMN02745192_1140 [Xylanibacter ruminicola]
MFNVSMFNVDLRSREVDFLSARGRIFFLVWEHHLHLHLDNAKVRNFRHIEKYQLLMNC